MKNKAAIALVPSVALLGCAQLNDVATSADETAYTLRRTGRQFDLLMQRADREYLLIEPRFQRIADDFELFSERIREGVEVITQFTDESSEYMDQFRLTLESVKESWPSSSQISDWTESIKAYHPEAVVKITKRELFDDMSLPQFVEFTDKRIGGHARQVRTDLKEDLNEMIDNAANRIDPHVEKIGNQISGLRTDLNKIANTAKSVSDDWNSRVEQWEERLYFNNYVGVAFVVVAAIIALAQLQAALACIWSIFLIIIRVFSLGRYPSKN